jgi:hypothetical protein
MHLTLCSLTESSSPLDFRIYIPEPLKLADILIDVAIAK